MLHLTAHSKKGFTLIELAIVLTIAGLLFVGLWRLLAGGNQQIRDQSAANEQQQLINAVRTYLASTQGQVFLGNIAANGNAALPLPTVNGPGVCTIAPATLNQFCNYLPTAFINTTPNAYGQNYNIRVLKDGTVAPNPPNSYSFMIATTIGDTIPDTSGGRISAAIGNDGGFIYTGNVCGAPTTQMACGAYGTWSVNSNTVYGLGPTASGHIASRTFVSPGSDNLTPWLERNTSLPDTNFSLNTMSTDLYLGLNPPAGANSNIFMAPSTALTNGGTINLEGGTITGNGNSASNITLGGGVAAPNTLLNLSGGNSAVYVLNATNGCTINTVDAFGNPTNTTPGPPLCTYSINTDNIHITGFGWANAFYAFNFNYTASDIRFKTNIRPLEDALTDVMRLKPVSYTLKSSGKENMGLIAQDLEKIYPQLVTSGDGMKFVSYDGLIAPLVSAVQELKKENDQLREQLRVQKERQDKLEKKIELSDPGSHF